MWRCKVITALAQSSSIRNRQSSAPIWTSVSSTKKWGLCTLLTSSSLILYPGNSYIFYVFFQFLLPTERLYDFRYLSLFPGFDSTPLPRRFCYSLNVNGHKWKKTFLQDWEGSGCWHGMTWLRLAACSSRFCQLCSCVPSLPTCATLTACHLAVGSLPLSQMGLLCWNREIMYEN